MSNYKEKRAIRVLIASEYQFMRQSLKLLLERAGIEVVGVTAGGLKAVDGATRLDPDVILLDMGMNELNGLAALSIIKTKQPKIDVFVFGSDENNFYWDRARELGATSFTPKDVDPHELFTAIGEILSKMGRCLEARPKTGLQDPNPR